jgi:Glycosyltransferase family 87
MKKQVILIKDSKFIFFAILFLLVTLISTFYTSSANYITEYVCEGKSCTLPNIEKNDKLQVDIEIGDIPPNCSEALGDKSIQLLGKCGSTFIISTYLNPSITAFGPPIKSLKKHDVISFLYSKYSVTILRNNRLVYTHFTPLGITTEGIKVGQGSSSKVFTKIAIKILKYENYTAAKLIQAAMCIILLAFLHQVCKNMFFSNFEISKSQDFNIPGLVKLLLPLLIPLGFILHVAKHRMLDFNAIDTPFGTIAFAFSDYWQLANASSYDKPYDEMSINYPPMGLALIKLLGHVNPYIGFSLVIYCGFLLSAIVANSRIVLNFKATGVRSLVISIIFFPIIFGIARGNIDLATTSLVFLWVYFMRLRKPLVSVVMLTMAISLKLWPAVFVLFYLRRRKTRESVFIVFGFSLLNFASNYILGYKHVATNFLVWIKELRSANEGSSLEFVFNTSIMQPIKILSAGLFTWVNQGSLDFASMRQVLLWPWLILQIFLLLIGIILYLRIKFVTKYHEILFLCLLILLIPSPSYLYRSSVLAVVFYLYSVEFGYNSDSRLVKRLKGIDRQIFSLCILGVSSWNILAFEPWRIPVSAFLTPGLLMLALTFLVKTSHKSSE